MYKKVIIGGVVTCIQFGDNLTIPTDPANTDYQQYLAWLAEGNEPEVIDLSV